MAENGFKPFQFSQLNQKKKNDADKTTAQSGNMTAQIIGTNVSAATRLT